MGRRFEKETEYSGGAMTEKQVAQWKHLTKKYPERAGRAWELYHADKKKTANPTTYFNFAGKKEYWGEKRYQENLKKFASKFSKEDLTVM